MRDHRGAPSRPRGCSVRALAVKPDRAPSRRIVYPPPSVEWLEHDEVDLAALPPWASGADERLDGQPYEVAVLAEGIVLRRGRLAAAVRWDEILVPIALEDPRRLLIAAPRRPPHVPWFELAGRDVERIERAVRARLEALDHHGYRERRRRRPMIPPDEVLTQVLARRPLPGAVEIPAATPSVLRSALLGGTIGGLTVGFYGLMVGTAGAMVGLGLGVVGGAGLMGVVEAVKKRTVGRVLVLTPDGFVGGLDGQSLRAVPWLRVSRFATGVDDQGRDALEVFGVDQELVARVAARWFGAPLDVIVAVAEAYRTRASRELGD